MTALALESPTEFTVDAIRVRQPIGEFLIASIPSKQLWEISYFDVRRMLKERDVETYLGIQRPLNENRVSDLQNYVRTVDACFPTAIILAVDSRCAVFDENAKKLTIRNVPNPDDGEEPVLFRNIAKVLDGQHRIAGLFDYPKNNFEVNVSIFVDIDMEDQAYIFSTVNLFQTKVTPSLAYDLSELAKARSPQKTCHNVTVALDQVSNSPFHNRIKRLGVATPGRRDETLTQATFVESLMPFISGAPTADRDILKRGNKLDMSDADIEKHPLRPFFVAGEDTKIADILFMYFSAVSVRWPSAWKSKEKGIILNRTNGFRALMRTLLHICRKLKPHRRFPDQSDFQSLLSSVKLEDKDFTTDEFKPGTSGESSLFNKLMEDMSLVKQRKMF